MNLDAGQRLGERYVLSDRIAAGGMGEVWRGVDEVLGRPVAVKVLRGDLAADHAFRARFREEARTAGGLSHGGIAAVYDYGEAEGFAYLVMELVEGEPLSAILARDGALGTDRTLDLLAQAARALHAAHVRGVVHRDVKPANLIVTSDQRVKVTDFGIARPRDHEPLTATGQVMGTAHYLAPELARGEVATPRSDVYALGIVAYECLAGRRPFDGDNQIAVATAQLQDPPPPLPETIPLPVRQVVSAALAKRPQDRPAGAQALAVALEDIYRARRHPQHAKHADGAGAARAQSNGVVATAPAALPPAAARASAAPVAWAAAPAASADGPASSSGAGEAEPERPVPVDAAAGRRQQTPEQRQQTPEQQGPPTAVLPADETDGLPGARGLQGLLRRWRRRKGTLPLLVLSGLVVVAALLGASLSDSGGDRSGAASTPAPSRATSTHPATSAPSGTPRQTPTGTASANDPAGRIMLRPEAFIGADVTAVRNALRGLGLRTKIRRVFSTRPRGTVLGIEPAGLVVAGSTVTLVVADNHRGGQ